MHTVRGLIEDSRHSAKQIDRLHDVIDKDGGPDTIKSCGQPVSSIGYQSAVAWYVDLNVGNVGFRPGKSIGRGNQIVLFKPHDNGWQVRLYNLPESVKARCDQLKIDTDFGWAGWLRREVWLGIGARQLPAGEGGPIASTRVRETRAWRIVEEIAPKSAPTPSRGSLRPP